MIPPKQKVKQKGIATKKNYNSIHCFVKR